MPWARLKTRKTMSDREVWRLITASIRAGNRNILLPNHAIDIEKKKICYNVQDVCWRLYERGELAWKRGRPDRWLITSPARAFEEIYQTQILESITINTIQHPGINGTIFMWAGIGSNGRWIVMNERTVLARNGRTYSKERHAMLKPIRKKCAQRKQKSKKAK